MELPSWVKGTIERFDAPPTGKVIITLERYQGGVTKMEIGSLVRITPEKVDTEIQRERGNAPIVKVQPR